MAYASFSQFLERARKGRRVAAHLDAGRDRFGDCGMGRSRNEISPWRQSAALRTTADRRQGLQIPRRDQYHGFGETNGAGAAARQYRRHRAGNSAHSQGQTPDRSARRMEPPQAGRPAAPCAAKACQIRRLPGGGPPLRGKFNVQRSTSNVRSRGRFVFAFRSADSEMLAERRRALHHFA